MRPARQLKAVDFDQHRHTKRYKISPIKTLPDLHDAMVDLIGERVGIMSISDHRRFFTFGSCFAVNIGEALRIKGANVYTTRFTEDVNSPFNNRVILRRIFLNEQSAVSDELAANTGADYEEIKKELIRATDVIFTLGNIFHLEGPAGHTMLATKQCTLARETYAETVECLREIIQLLRENTTAKIFVSVSPIPISGYIGNEFASAIEADCASKSQLVAAIRSLNGFVYIPTFEIFRWLPAHQAFPTFGAGRDNARHLWGSHVGMAMGVLCGAT